jgi:hypothetical protein
MILIPKLRNESAINERVGRLRIETIGALK